ncbi:MAG: hypothetical protein UV08_C0004G0007 [Parcubacteria group bacterium GW2011_GWA2_42_18]|nr:MAG: hypothetical protein UV08_C0004G0007 [Parcubacteria group bacterium GW2011_GWA2_42_18]KKT75737.1 MAG: hypothetical protein UW72_C0019G0004 [Parcubacteria group bacterium GW2011_GWF2_44_7]
MTKQELEELTKKIVGGKATKEEAGVFLAEVGKLLDEVAEAAK